MPGIHERQRAATDTFVLPTRWATIEESLPYLRVRDLIELYFEDEKGPVEYPEYAVISDIKEIKGQTLVAASWMPTIEDAIKMVFRLGSGTHWGSKFRNTVHGGKLRISKLRILQRDIPLYKEKAAKYSAAIHERQREAVSPPRIYFYVRVMCEGLDINDFNSVRYDDFIVSIDETEDDIERTWFDDYEMEQWDYGNEMNLRLPNCRSCNGWRLGGDADNVELFELNDKTISVFDRIGNDHDLIKWQEARKKKGYSAAVHRRQRPAVDTRTPLAKHIGHEVIIQQLHQPYNLDVNAAALTCKPCTKVLYWVNQSAGDVAPRPSEDKFGKLISWPSYGIIMDHTGHRMVVEHEQGLTYVMCKRCNMSVLVAKDPDTAYSAAIHKKQRDAAEPLPVYGRLGEGFANAVKKEVEMNLVRFANDYVEDEDGRFVMYVFTLANGGSGTHMPGEVADFWGLELPDEAKGVPWNEWEFAWEELEDVSLEETDLLNKWLGLPGNFYCHFNEADGDYALFYMWDPGDHPEWEALRAKAYSAAIHERQRKAMIPPPRVPLSKNGVEAKCPFCDGKLDYGHAEEDGDGYYYDVTCKDCSWKGLEVYTLNFVDFSDNENSNIPGTPGECPGCGEGLDYGASDISAVGSLFYEASCTKCGWRGSEWYTMEYNNHADPEGNIIQSDGKKTYSAIHRAQQKVVSEPEDTIVTCGLCNIGINISRGEPFIECSYCQGNFCEDCGGHGCEHCDIQACKSCAEEHIEHCDECDIYLCDGCMKTHDEDAHSDNIVYSAVHKSQTAAARPDPRPRPGDFVRVMKSDDTLIKVGSEGVIEGVREGTKRPEDEYLVMFNPSPAPWWHPDEKRPVISCSGGPAFYVNMRALRFFGVVERNFQQWGPYGPGANNAIWVTHRVNLFDIDMPEARATEEVYSAAVHKLQRKAVDRRPYIRASINEVSEAWNSARTNAARAVLLHIGIPEDEIAHGSINRDVDLDLALWFDLPDDIIKALIDSYSQGEWDRRGPKDTKYSAAIHIAQQEAARPEPRPVFTVPTLQQSRFPRGRSRNSNKGCIMRFAEGKARGTSKHLSFYDDTLYSWAEPIAKRYPLRKGSKKYRFKVKGRSDYGSPTSNRHCRVAWSVLSDYGPVKEVPSTHVFSSPLWQSFNGTIYSAVHRKQRDATKPVKYEAVFSYDEVKAILDAWRAGAEMEDIARKQNIKSDIVSDICSSYEFYRTANDDEFDEEFEKKDPEYMLIVRVIDREYGGLSIRI